MGKKFLRLVSASCLAFAVARAGGSNGAVGEIPADYDGNHLFQAMR